MSINDGGPAFPRDHASDGHNGMTLRDYFAAKAMQALIGTRHADYQNEDGADVVANDAFQVADAMLKAREAK